MSITVSHLSFAYPRHPVLEDISFSAQPGLTAVLGSNGAGKSTLLRCILGLLDGYRGTISLCGQDITRLSPRERSALAAYVPQLHQSVFSYPAFDVVLMGAACRLPVYASPGKAERIIAEQAFEKLEITQLRGRSFSHLSGGERQMILIARALAQQTSVLIMDEPTASLDYGNQLLVMERIRRLAGEGYTILLSTHDPQGALQHADHLLALYGGHIAAFGTTKEVLTPQLLRTLYGVDVTIKDGVILPRRNRT